MVEKITKWSYLEPLLFKRDFIHLAEISKKIGKNHSVVRKYLNYFEEQGIIKKKKLGRMSLYKFNLENFLIIEVISLVEKERVVFSAEDLILRELIGALQAFINLKIVLFGSFVENPRKAKDIDLLVVGKCDEESIKNIGKKIGKKIHLIAVKNLGEVSDSLKEEIKGKHLILNGVEEIIKWLI